MQKRIAWPMMLMSACIMLLCTCSVDDTSDEFALYYEGVPFETIAVERPQFPAYSVTITDFGAVGDGMTDNTMAINDAIVGKHFEEGDELYIDVPEKHYKFIEREFKDKLTEDEYETLYEFLEIKRKQDPDWGKFGLFE